MKMQWLGWNGVGKNSKKPKLAGCVSMQVNFYMSMPERKRVKNMKVAGNYEYIQNCWKKNLP